MWRTAHGGHVILLIPTAGQYRHQDPPLATASRGARVPDACPHPPTSPTGRAISRPLPLTAARHRAIPCGRRTAAEPLAAAHLRPPHAMASHRASSSHPDNSSRPATARRPATAHHLARCHPTPHPAAPPAATGGHRLPPVARPTGGRKASRQPGMAPRAEPVPAGQRTVERRAAEWLRTVLAGGVPPRQARPAPAPVHQARPEVGPHRLRHHVTRRFGPRSPFWCSYRYWSSG